MAIKIKEGGFACSVCGNKFSSSAHADACRDSHDLIYLPVSTEELNLLWNAIVLGNTELIPPSLLDTIRRYTRPLVTRDGTQNKV